MSLDDFAPGGKAHQVDGTRRIASPDSAVALWFCNLERDAVESAACAALLSPDELARAARFGTERLRERYIVGRATLRRLLAAATGLRPAEVPIRRGLRGRPQLSIATTLDFNVSHTREVALIGLTHRRRIGVDIEHADRDVGVDRLARKLLTADERTTLDALSLAERRVRFLRYWTCKEAMSKATGDGLAAPFGALQVELGDPPRLVAGPAPYVAPHWRLAAPALPPGYLATVALWTPA